MRTLGNIQKRCLVGSLAAHGFLLLVVLFGAAFFVSHKPPPLDPSTLRVVPQRLVDGLSGGGGNPQLPVNNDQKKGDPNAKPEVKPAPVPPAPRPTPVEPKRIEPRVEPKAVQPQPTVSRMPKDPILKPVTRKVPVKPDSAESSKSAKDKAKAESDARAAREAADKLAKQIGKAMTGLQQGFQQGTAVDVGGPGGVAYADYGQFVKQIYDDAWVTTDLLSADDNAATIVKVTVARDGHIIRAVIADRSGDHGLDQSVQRTLEKVTKLPPFPEETKDTQRTFTIRFSMKARRGVA
jgi:TonB family protein